MDELDQLLAKANLARHKGASEADIGDYLREETNGRFTSRQALLQHLAQRDMTNAVAPGKLAGSIEAFGRGASLGFSDELAGALGALTGGSYTADRDALRAQQDIFQQQHPVLNAVSQGAGGLATGIASSGLLPAPATTIGGLGLQAGGTGAGFGALSSLGENRDPHQLLNEAVRGAAFGGLTGSLFGLATKPVAGAIGGVYRAGRSILAPAADAEATAGGILAQHLPPNASDVLTGLEEARPGQARLMDVSPELADVATSRNVPLRTDVLNQLEARNAGAGERLASDLAEAAQGPGATTVDALGAQRAAADRVRMTARRLYGPLEEAYKEIPDGPGYRALIRLSTQDPIVGRVVGGAMKDLGQRGRPGFLTMQTALQTLEDDASQAFQSRRSNEGVRLSQSARTLEAAMEDAMPGFRLANAGYAPAKETIAAFDQGAGAIQRDPRVIQSEINALKSPDAKSAYRMRAMDDVLTRLRGLTEGSDAFREAMVRGNQDLEPKLRALFPNPEDLDQFLAGADAEQAFRRTFNAFPGSKTFNRGQLSGEIFQSPGMGGRGGVLSRLASLFENHALAGRDARISQVLGDRLSTQGPEAQAVINQANITRASQAARDALASRVALAGAATSGNAASGPIRWIPGLATFGVGSEILKKLGLITPTPDRGY